MKMEAPAAIAPAPSTAAAPILRAGHHRWLVCALLFLGTTINYIDRQVIGILKPTLMAELGWTQVDYGDIVFAFQAAYAIGYAGGGWFMDRVGVRRQPNGSPVWYRQLSQETRNKTDCRLLATHY